MAKKAPAGKKAATRATGRAGKSAKGDAAATPKATRKTVKKVAKTTDAKVKKTAATTKKVVTKTKKTAPKAGKVARKTATKATTKPKAVKAKLPKCPLAKKELAEFRKMLLAKRRTLLGDMTGMEAEALHGSSAAWEQSSMPVHMADIGTDNYEQEFTLGLLESERQLLREIDEALERMALGTYGICMGTGGEIGTARLRAKPWAKYTIAYVRKIEQGQIRVPAIDYGTSDEDDDDDDDDYDDDDDADADADADADDLS